MLKQISSEFSLKFYSFLINIDTFGIVYSPRFFGRTKIKSIYGALLTILLMILGIVKIFQLIDRIISKSDFNIIMEKKVNSNHDISLRNITILFCIESTYDDFFNYLSFEPFSDNLLGETSDVEKIKIKLGGVLSYTCNKYNLSNMILEDSENIFLLRTLDTYIISQKYNYALRLTVIYNEIYIDDTNYFEPIAYKKHMMETHQINLFNYDLDCNVDEISVQYNNKFNFLFFNNRFHEEKSYSTISECKLSPYSAPYQGSLHIKLKLSGWKYKYIFIGFDIERLISEFGGYFHTLYLIFRFLAHFSNKLIMKKKIFSKFKKRFAYYRNIKNEINFDDNEKIRLSTLQNLYNNNNEKNKVIRNIEINKNINLFFDSQTINLTKNRMEIKNSNKMSVIDHSNVLLNIEKMKQNELNGSYYMKSKKDNHEEVKQFLNVFDCYIFYQLYKDIKILELLCLSSKNAEIYYKFRKVPLNLYKLEKFVNRIIIEEEENNYFDDQSKKIKILFKSIIKY